jgi:gentisate 1,2-dioxygenase
MSSQLGTREELPKAYLDELEAMSVTPLWPSLRQVLPYDQPTRATRPFKWSYRDVRPYLMQAGELTPMEKAERRVLVLANPGFGIDGMRATPSIYVGLQLILPGETAPCHRHTPTAVRFVVEGHGGYTVVEGEKLPMEKGDLILTPSGMWHDHGHEGDGPVVWLDALDLPTVHYLEASYCVEGEVFPPSNLPDASQTRYRRAGLVPFQSLGQKQGRYPLCRYPWSEVRAALTDLGAHTPTGEIVQLAYVNPETGEECLPILGFSAQMIRPGEEVAPTRRSASSVMHVIEGEGETEIDGETISWEESDTVSVPTHAAVRHANRSTSKPAFLFHVDDAPLHRKLGFYEEFAGA